MDSERTVSARVPDDMAASVKRMAALKGTTPAVVIGEAWALYMDTHRDEIADQFYAAAKRIRGKSDDRTPPKIVASAMDQEGALTAFIAQELEQWGFATETRKLDATVIVNADGFRFAVEVSRVY